jgi:Dolichyl-phosphate-mannose-protein mannosyltransferase
MAHVRRLAAEPAVLIALLLATVLIALATRYGYHRDELYFLEAGDHLAWGYPDQGPLTPLIAHLMDVLAPGSITALRLPSALAAAAVVLIAGRLAADLGGGRRAEAIAAGSVAVGVVFLQTGHTIGTTTFDLLAWTALTWIAVRAVRDENDRLWLPAGLVLGVGLLNKPLPAFLAAGLLAGVLISGPRRLVRSPWVWSGAALALLLWLPWLIWQADHGWPQQEVSREIAEGGSTSSQPRWAFLPFQFLLVSPLLAPIWVAGLVRLFRDPELRSIRFLGWTWVVLAALFIATGGKPYYLAGLLPLLLAAGAVEVERWLDRGSRRSRRLALGAAFVGSAVVGGPIGLPLLPVDGLDPVVAVNPDVGETVGWPEYTRTVAGVRESLPRGSRPVVFTANYGEAGAIDRYGRDLGLSRAYSGHNGYWYWGIPPGSRSPVIVVGFARPSWLERRFRGCAVKARIEPPGGIDNDEDGSPVWTCAGVRRPWRELWPELQSFG